MNNKTANAKKPLIITGATASGKTALAFEIAAYLEKNHDEKVEIISVDSALVFREMNIGTAKPSQEELASVIHHLIDIREPTESYSAAEFINDAQILITEIQKRGARPLLVGGTMLYLKALQTGLDDMPKANLSIRAQIDQEAAQKGWAVLHDELAQIDPITAERLSPFDSQRIQRALEVFRISGFPLSHFHQKNRANQQDKNADFDLPILSLEPQNRAWLHERIALRFDLMLKMGFVDEVQRLRQRGDLHLDLPSMRCVGYRQAWEALDGLYPLSELRDKGIFATRQLAKRQLTWLRGMTNRHVLFCDQDKSILSDQAFSWLNTQCAANH